MSEVSVGREPPQRFMWWWEAIIDWMLMNPDRTIAEAGREFGVSKGHIYRITASDMFKERFAQRRAELNERLNEEITKRLQGVASKGLELIQNELDNQQVRKTEFVKVVDLTDRALHRLGYGVPRQGGTTINNQVVNGPVMSPASSAAVIESRDRIRAEQMERIRASATTIEVIDDSPPGGSVFTDESEAPSRAEDGPPAGPLCGPDPVDDFVEFFPLEEGV